MDFIDFKTIASNITIRYLLFGYFFITVSFCLILTKVANRVCRKTIQELKLIRDITCCEERLSELVSLTEDDESSRSFVEYQKVSVKSNKLRINLDHRVRERKNKRRRLILIVWTIVPIVFACIFAMFVFKSSSTTPLDIWNEKFSAFVDKFDKFLPIYSRRVIQSSIEEVLFKKSYSQSHEPSVILLIGSEKSSSLVREMMISLSTLISEMNNKKVPPLLDGFAMDSCSIHENFTQLLGSNDYNNVLLDGINKLRGSAAQSLHRYTDHSNAVFKNIVILLSAYSENYFTNSNMKLVEMDRIANNLLEVSWIKDLSEDQVSPLLTRLTPSVAVILDKDA